MGHKTFRDLDKSQRRQKIIDTAVELFHKRGYRSTTLDDLAQELGITKAALYHYVESKEELLFIIYTQALNSIFLETKKIASTNLPPDKKMREIIRNHIKNIIIRNLSLFFVFFTEENQLPDKYYRMVKEKKREYDQIIQNIIQEGISSGIFENDDPRLLSYGIIGMCNWLYKWYQPKIPYSADAIADQFIKILERGYLRKDKKGIIDAENPNGGKVKEGFKLTPSQVLSRLKESCEDTIKLLNLLDKEGKLKIDKIME
jgi:AcrR family transcriptional regulator